MASELDTLAERYVLEAPIARGGMGTVWRARDEVLARPVAVKILHADLAEDEAFLQRFRREALAAARLGHPNIVAIYDTGTEVGDGAGGDRHFIVMEHCGRGTLADVIAGEGPLEPARVASIGRAICDALAYAHRQGIIHRDIKPANVLITDDGSLKVGDFGIAKAAFASGDLTTTGSILGTVTYISPEQAEGREPDARSDLYALGIVLYEAVTGRVPFADETPVATAMKHLREAPPAPRSLRAGIPRPLEAVILRALSKDPDARFQDAETMAEALGETSTHPTTHAMPLPGRTTPRRSASHPSGAARTDLKWVGPVIAVVALVLLLAVGLPALLEQRDEAGPGGGNEQEQDEGGEAGAGEPIEISNAYDFDPHGTHGEHPEDVPNTYDGDPATEWQTQTYNDALHLLKPGVGIVYDLGEEREVTGIEIEGDIGEFEIRAGSGEGDDENSFNVVAGGLSLSGSETFELDPTSARYWLIWITDLPGGGGGSARIAEVSLVGP